MQLFVNLHTAIHELWIYSLKVVHIEKLTKK